MSNKNVRKVQEYATQSSSSSSCDKIPQDSITRAKNKQGVTALKEILKEKIKIDKDELKNSKQIVTEFLDGLVKFLKETNEDFQFLFQKLYYTGSFYEDLRISSANEFDINLVLKSPSKTENVLKVEFLKSCPFATYQLKPNLKAEDTTFSKFFEDGYLIPSKVNIWMQSIIDKTLKNPSYQKPNSIKEITPSMSGPAKTMRLLTSKDYIIEIDLVPVFQLPLLIGPTNLSHRILNDFKDFNIKQDAQFMFLVPKPLENSTCTSSQSMATLKRTWRVHLPEVEKNILHDLGCVKPVIKLLKLLRDKYKWQILASYYLKTILLWEVRENANSAYWKEDQMYIRLVQVLKKLTSNVEEKKIRNFFFPNFNLIEKMNDSLSKSICGCLKCIIKKVESDAMILHNVFE